jgi:hypothetical protein
MRYRINAPHVSSETIEGETIVIDFVSGAYFSTDKLGAVIWEKLKVGLSPEHIVAEIKQHYPDHGEECGQAIASFIAQLESEKLVVIDSGEGESVAVAIQDHLCYPESYAAPILNKYSDMQDLLLLDPIHETDDQGWPIRKKQDGD